MNVIGLSGKMGTGKTTLANLICSLVPGAVRMSFADALRGEVAEHFGFRLELVREPFFKDLDLQIGLRWMTGRELLQWWGTEVRRKADACYWSDKMRGYLFEQEEEGCPLVVIDDVRFLDEAALITASGGKLYRLVPYNGWNPGPNAEHASETALDDYPDFACRLAPAFGNLAPSAAMIAENLRRTGRPS